MAKPQANSIYYLAGERHIFEKAGKHDHSNNANVADLELASMNT